MSTSSIEPPELSEQDCQSDSEMPIESVDSGSSVQMSEFAKDCCAKCGSDAPWNGSSWCPRCGYYPEVDAIVQSNPELQKTTEEPKPVAESQEVASTTHWIVMLLGGIAGIVTLTMAARVWYHYNDGTRGIWTLWQFGFGLVGFAVAQVAATNYAMSKSAGVSMMDAVNQPIAVWKPTIDSLPNGKDRIYLAVWGLTTSLAGLLIVGGVNSELIFGNTQVRRKADPNIIQQVSEAAKQNAGGDAEGMEESLAALAEQPEEPLPDAERPLTCQIYGYMENSDSSGIGRILCCSIIHGERKHVASVSIKRLPERVKKNLLKYLESNRTENPVVDTRYRAKWVNPLAAADIRFKEWTANKTLVQPKLVRLHSSRSSSQSAAPPESTDSSK